jgi:rubrerythrin
MKQFSSVDEALDFAIEKEEEAAQFYTGLAGKMDNPAMKQAFEDFANEEKGHKAKLQEVKKGKLLLPAEAKVTDLKVGDYLVDVEPKDDMTYQEALILAMKSEKAAFRLYTNLAASTDDPTIQDLFLGLAQEEAKHKLRFEIEYDDNIMKWN